jgi:hypothetical protein
MGPPPSNRGKAMRTVCALLAFLLMWPTPLSADEPNAQLDALRELHFCEILTYLKTIRSHPPTPRNRYLTIDIDGRQGYVQCLFYDRDRRIFCEAASGFYEDPRVQFVAPAQLPALKALGFSTRATKGNYQQRRAVKGEQTLADVADLLIRTLQAIYGAVPEDRFVYKAPLVPEMPPTGNYAGGKCPAAMS